MSDLEEFDFLQNLTTALPDPTLLVRDSTLNPARWMHERVARSIKAFEDDLDEEHEIGARLVNFGTNVTIHIIDVGYWGPDIIKFYGFDASGSKVELIQHVSQLSMLLVAVRKVHESPRRIGFALVRTSRIQRRKSRASRREVWPPLRPVPPCRGERGRGCGEDSMALCSVAFPCHPPELGLGLTNH
jgi:hypothetical protein